MRLLTQHYSSASQNGTGTMSRRQNTIQELLQNCSDCLMRAELIVQPVSFEPKGKLKYLLQLQLQLHCFEGELKYGDGIQISRNRELEDCFAQANEQMDILDGLIREMRQMGQPCELYQKRSLTIVPHCTYFQ
ncbi:UNVERIFIED_CONTAM: hypothetical protein K2H54_057328 [Gekko kuhli]